MAEGDSFDFAGNEVRILDVSGHTVGHIAYYIPALKAAFTADSLMALGCGRLFEGTPAQMMWNSLSRLAALPDRHHDLFGPRIHQGQREIRADMDPDNPALKKRAEDIAAGRAKGEPTVPSLAGAGKRPRTRSCAPAIP